MSLSRTDKEKIYWDEATESKNLEREFISEWPKDKFKIFIGKLNGKVLDLGCGIGRLMEKNYWGVDTSTKMIAIAQATGVGKYRACNGRDIPFNDNFFDNAFSVLMFQHIPNKAKDGYIEEVYRVLKPGGRFLVQFIEEAEEGPFSKTVCRKKMIEKFSRVGFKDLDYHSKILDVNWSWIGGTK